MEALVAEVLDPMAPIREKVRAIMGADGRLIGGSKTIYCDEHPDNLIVFNANVATQKHGKIWYGDLDITKDMGTLDRLSVELGERIYVIRESQGRFGAEALVDGNYEEWRQEEIRTAFRQQRFAWSNLKALLRNFPGWKLKFIKENYDLVLRRDPNVLVYSESEDLRSEIDKLTQLWYRIRDLRDATPASHGLFDRRRAEVFGGAVFSIYKGLHEVGDSDYKFNGDSYTYVPDYSAYGITDRIRFSDIDDFESKKGNKRKPVDSPLEVLAKFVCKSLGIRLRKSQMLDSSQLVMHENDLEILMYLCRRWAKSNFDIHPARLDSEVAWMTFSSPCRLGEDQYVPPGYIYIKDRSKLVVSRGNTDGNTDDNGHRIDGN